LLTYYKIKFVKSRLKLANFVRNKICIIARFSNFAKRENTVREFDLTDMKRASRDWCHFLPGMLSGRLLLLMECFVRARNPEVHSRPSRERPLYMGGPFFLRMHYISLVKFTLRTTEVGQTLEFVNCTR